MQIRDIKYGQSLRIDAEPVTSSSATEIFRLRAYGRPLILTLIVGAGGGLGHLKITRAAALDGTHKDLAVDADLNSFTEAIPDCQPVDAYLSAANGKIQMRLDGGGIEYGIYAGKASGNTTLALEGSAL